VGGSGLISRSVRPQVLLVDKLRIIACQLLIKEKGDAVVGCSGIPQINKFPAHPTITKLDLVLVSGGGLVHPVDVSSGEDDGRARARLSVGRSVEVRGCRRTLLRCSPGRVYR